MVPFSSFNLPVLCLCQRTQQTEKSPIVNIKITYIPIYTIPSNVTLPLSIKRVRSDWRIVMIKQAAITSVVIIRPSLCTNAALPDTMLLCCLSSICPDFTPDCLCLPVFFSVCSESSMSVSVLSCFFREAPASVPDRSVFSHTPQERL